MKTNRFPLRSLCAALVLAAAGSASAATVAWTDWTFLSTDLRTASGTMGGVGVSVNAGNPMNGVSQLSGPGNCINYWTQPVPADAAYTGGSVGNAPTACEQLGLSSANSITVNFSSAVGVLYMALLSVGQNGLPVTYDFNQAFTIDSEGRGYWGNDGTDGVLGAGDSLTMREFHGVLRFNAPVTSITTWPSASRTRRPCRCCRASAASRSSAWCRSARLLRRRRACRRTGSSSSRRSRARPSAPGWAR
jgi:hypothetical protein